jgi:hypothetical protein
MKTRLFKFWVLFLIGFGAKAQWNELGGSNSSTFDNQVKSICTDNDGNIYAAGVFTNTSGKFYVAKWNGNTWSELGGTNALGANYHILALCTDPNGNIYAAGRFTNGSSGITGSKYVAKWNGNSWSELVGLDTIHDINCLCSDSNGNIYAAGDFSSGTGHHYVAKWNGTSWSALGGFESLGANSYIHALYCDKSNNNIYVGGYFTNDFGKTYVARWNGFNWSELGGANSLGANNLIDCITGDNYGNIYAAGFFTNGPDINTSKRYVAVWNGISWSELGGYNSLSANFLISDLCVDPFGSVYAAGEFTNGVNVSYGNKYVAKWDGSSWSEVGGLNNLGANALINSICSDMYGNLYAAGGFYNNQSHQYVAKFNSTSTLQQISLVGTATDANNFTTNHIMSTTNGEFYTINSIFLSAAGASPSEPGKVRFKSITNPNNNWGGDGFSSGVGYQNGPDITVDVSGYYSVYFNLATGDYFFSLNSSNLPTISLIGTSNGTGWGPITLETTDGKSYSKNYVPLENGEAKFYKDYELQFWDPYDLGDTQFPSGIATHGGGNIPIPAGQYNIEFYRPTGEYHFNATPADGEILITSNTNLINTSNLPQSVTFTATLNNLGRLNNLLGLHTNLYFDEAVFDVSTATVDYANSIFGIVDTDCYAFNGIADIAPYFVALYRNPDNPIAGDGLLFKITLNTKQTIPNISNTSCTATVFNGMTSDFGEVYIPNASTITLNVNNGLGVTDFSNEAIVLYPNPTTDILNIDFKNKELFKNGYTLQTYNALGQLINNIPLNSDSSQISTKKWGSTGIYYIKIIDESNTCIFTKKITIQ